MRRLLTGTAIAALIAGPALAETDLVQKTDTQLDAYIAEEVELPNDYDAADLNQIMLEQLETRPAPDAYVETTYEAETDYAKDKAMHKDDMSSDATLIETAQNDARFTTLVSLVELSKDELGLTEGMTYTIFAPVDDAFAPLSVDRVDYLTSEAGAQERADILKVHIIPASITAEDVPMTGTMVETLSGHEIWVQKFDNGTVMVGNAKVVEADIEASNGIIHAVDAVIMTETMTEGS